MLIDIFKSPIFTELEKYNSDISLICNSFTEDSWFNIDKVRELPPVNYNINYKLLIYSANYLPMFLLNLLYPKHILIEDFGCGDGRFIYYLSKLGFHNFSVWDNWIECPEFVFKNLMQLGNIKYKLNDINTNPEVVNNSMAPSVFPTYGFEPDSRRNLDNLELITIYQNKYWEYEMAPKVLLPRDFVFLCRDQNDSAHAYCKRKLLAEYQERLMPYVATV